MIFDYHCWTKNQNMPEWILTRQAPTWPNNWGSFRTIIFPGVSITITHLFSVAPQVYSLSTGVDLFCCCRIIGDDNRCMAGAGLKWPWHLLTTARQSFSRNELDIREFELTERVCLLIAQIMLQTNFVVEVTDCPLNQFGEDLTGGNLTQWCSRSWRSWSTETLKKTT